MTSLATALGALPIAMALGAGAKSRMGMGIVIVGGVLFSMVLTLYVVPAIYCILIKNTKDASGQPVVNEELDAVETQNKVAEEIGKKINLTKDES
jgi:predicted RND superfamily exporter protein